jgi:hypothetical protein
MEIQDTMRVHGHVWVRAWNENGDIQWEIDFPNLVTNAGLAAIASRLNGHGSEAVFTAFALGTGTTAAAAGDTALESEITDSGLGRGAATVGRETTAVTNDTATWDKSWSVTGSKAVTEYGILNNTVSGGTLLTRTVQAANNVSNGWTLQMVYKIDFS